MICVECGEPVDSLYTKYTNGHIKLTDCTQCFKTADKYVEFDSVILFIDVLLMKPQAYKHMVFNLMSDDYDLNKEAKSEECRGYNPLSLWLRRNKVQRIRVLAVLFEIYLIWAYAEKNHYHEKFHNPFLITSAILDRHVIAQYLLFAVQCICNDIITHSVAQYFIFNQLHWEPKSSGKETTKYFKDALSLAIIISGGTKLFPILMLIWPYDDVAITNVINSVANINLVESLKVITGCSYLQASWVFASITLVKLVVTKSILALILSGGKFELWKLFIQNEWATILGQIYSAAHVFTLKRG